MAAKPNYETTADPLPNNRTGNLLVHQGHAFDHYSGRCSNDRGAIPNPPANRDMACPVCGEVKGFNYFTEDHCPQAGGQSRFGSRSCVVMTCADCNSNAAGGAYESDAAKLSRNEIPSERNVVYIAERQSGLVVVEGTDDSRATATDLKTAFLVAFAALGYRFALAPALKVIRRAIRDGNAPPIGGPMLGETLATWDDERVYEHERGWVFVVGRGFGWMLPAGERQTEPFGGSATALGWPETHSSGSRKQVTEHSQAGRLFHADFCPEPKHEIHGPKQTYSEWKL